MSWFVTSHTQTIRKSSGSTQSSGAVMPFAACFSTRDISSTSYPTATLTLFLAAATTSFLTITGILSVLPSFSPKRQKPSCFQKATNRLPTRLNGKELNVSAAAEKATPAGPAARVRTTVWTSPLPLPTLLRLSATVKRYKLIRKNGAAN